MQAMLCAIEGAEHMHGDSFNGHAGLPVIPNVHFQCLKSLAQTSDRGCGVVKM